jgi:glycosyltransferase involved in cell wall biosynthesis
VEPERVPYLLGAADAGLSFRSEAFSTRAIAPVKLGEYLLCGLPVIGTMGVGPETLDPHVFCAVGDDPDAAAEWLLGTVLPNRATLARDARALGMRGFSVEASVRAYLAALEPLMSQREQLP